MRGFQNCRIHNLRKNLERAGEVAEANAKRAKRKWRVSMSNAKAYLEAAHHYILKIGDNYSEQRCVMTGREALVRNRVLEQKFIQELDQNPSVRLGRWHLDKTKSEP